MDILRKIARNYKNCLVKVKIFLIKDGVNFHRNSVINTDVVNETGIYHIFGAILRHAYFVQKWDS